MTELRGWLPENDLEELPLKDPKAKPGEADRLEFKKNKLLGDWSGAVLGRLPLMEKLTLLLVREKFVIEISAFAGAAAKAESNTAAAICIMVGFIFIFSDFLRFFWFLVTDAAAEVMRAAVAASARVNRLSAFMMG